MASKPQGDVPQGIVPSVTKPKEPKKQNSWTQVIFGSGTVTGEKKKGNEKNFVHTLRTKCLHDSTFPVEIHDGNNKDLQDLGFMLIRLVPENQRFAEWQFPDNKRWSKVRDMDMDGKKKLSDDILLVEKDDGGGVTTRGRITIKVRGSAIDAYLTLVKKKEKPK